MKLSGIELVFDINGEVSEKGDFENLKIGGSGDIGPFRSILVEFEAMPTLQPATVDGKPVRQQFTITFSIENGYYRYKYEFHRIHIN